MFAPSFTKQAHVHGEAKILYCRLFDLWQKVAVLLYTIHCNMCAGKHPFMHKGTNANIQAPEN